MMAWMVKAALAALALYAVAVTVMFVIQRSLIYVPVGGRIDPSAAGLAGVAEQTLIAADGTRLIAWWVKPAEKRPVILYFHGNYGHLTARAPRMKIFQDDGFGVLMMSYRSYSGSKGRPSEAANVADAQMAFDWLLAQGIAPGKIVIFGESLGTGVGTQLALARPAAAGLVLDSPYTSLADVAAVHFPWLPVQLLISDRYDVIGRVGRLTMPLLILHGEADDVVPVAMGRAVFAAAHEPKQIFTFPGAAHIRHAMFGSFERVRDFVQAVTR